MDDNRWEADSEPSSNASHVHHHRQNYDRLIENTRVSRPDSRWTATFLATNHSTDSSPITALNFGSDGKLTSVAQGRGVIPGLDAVDTTQKGIRGTIAIVEDLFPDTVRYLGWRLGLDPAFFAQQLRDTRWENGRIGRAPKLPSTYVQTSMMHIDYMVPIVYPRRAPKMDAYAASQVRRRFAKSDTRLAHIRQKISFVRVEVQDSDAHPRWLAVILVDPPLGKTIRTGTANHIWNLEEREFGVIRPYQGGYVDFTEHRIEGPYLPKSSMMNDISYYFQHRYGDGLYAPILAVNDQMDPNLVSIGYFALKIVASQWVVTLQYMNQVASNNETFPVGRDRAGGCIERIESITTKLQTWRTRTIYFLRLLTDTVCVLELHMDPQNKMHKALLRDFEYLVEGMQTLKDRFETGVSIGMSMIQVEEAMLQGQATEDSLKESKDMKKLTNLALVFVPLSFVASLFGIEGPVAPVTGSKSGFWLYWAVALPLVVLVFVVAMMRLPGRMEAEQTILWVRRRWYRRDTQERNREKARTVV